jgi:hypothetical protein
MLKIWEWGKKTKKVIRPLHKTMNENPKCHMHIPQLRKGIYVLNIIVQTSCKKGVKEKDPKGTPKTLMPPAWVHKLDGRDNPEGNLKGDQIEHLRVQPQGLPNLIGKENDGKIKRQLKHAQ